MDTSFIASLNDAETFKIDNLLEHCYILDENEIPHKYQFLEANSILPGYITKVV